MKKIFSEIGDAGEIGLEFFYRKAYSRWTWFFWFVIIIATGFSSKISILNDFSFYIKLGMGTFLGEWSVIIFFLFIFFNRNQKKSTS